MLSNSQMKAVKQKESVGTIICFILLMRLLALPLYRIKQ